MTGRLGFDSRDQIAEWIKLLDLITDNGFEVPCTNYPDAYFPTANEHDLAAMAKASCDTCPVAMACLRYGMKWDMEGIWGGKTQEQRRNMNKGIKKRVA
jgi:hypothetical protein